MGTAMEHTTLQRLIQDARTILQDNLHEADGKLFVMPSGSLYPAAWGWDTPQIAEGLYADQPDTALRLLEDYLSYQWPDGMVPHIVFPGIGHGEKFDATAYFPPPHVWYMTGDSIDDYAAASPDSFMRHPDYAHTEGKTTGIAQYPIWALNLRRMHEQRPIPPKRLEKLVEQLDRFHRFFHEQRDPEGLGIVAEFHPWIGCDNAPPYDKALHRIAATATPEELESIHRQRVDVKKTIAAGGDPSVRPTDEDYVAFLKIAHGLARAGEKRHRGEPVTTDDIPFVVYSPMLNGMLSRAEDDLALLARAAGREDIAGQAASRAGKLRQGMMQHLWDGEGFAYLDGKTGEKENVAFLGSCIPLLDEKLPDNVRDGLRQQLRERFQDGFRHGFATTARDNPARIAGKAGFEACYWRGPVWLNMNELLAPYSDNPKTIRDDALGLAAKEGLREYYDAETGKGLGADRFGWTAARVMGWAKEALHETAQQKTAHGRFSERIIGESANEHHRSRA